MRLSEVAATKQEVENCARNGCWKSKVRVKIIRKEDVFVIFSYQPQENETKLWKERLLSIEQRKSKHDQERNSLFQLLQSIPIKRHRTLY